VYTVPRAPQSIGGVVDSTINLFKASFRLCWPAALLSGLLSIGLSVWLQSNLDEVVRAGLPAGTNPTTASLTAIRLVFTSPGVLIVYLLTVALGIVINLMMTITIVEVSAGRPTGNALTHFGTALKLVPGALLAALLIAVPLIVGMILLVIPGLYLMGRWSLWITAYAEQRGQATRSLGRSWELVGGNWWRTMAVLSVVGVVVLVLLIVLGALTGFLSALAGQTAATRALLSQIVQGVSQVVYGPALAAALVAIYQDLKLRKGGADIEARLGSIDAQQA
jgi:hypothetical protein